MNIYKTQMNLYTTNKAIWCMIFPTSLRALSWFTQLPPNSVDSFKTLSTKFSTQYATSWSHHMSSLATRSRRSKDDWRLMKQQRRSEIPRRGNYSRRSESPRRDNHSRHDVREVINTIARGFACKGCFSSAYKKHLRWWKRPQHQSIERPPKYQIEETTRVMVKEGLRGRILHVIKSSVE